MNKIFVYPKFDSKIDLGIRIGGPGLAHCLFTFARAIIYSSHHHFKFINPTWQRFGLGPYMRNESDKRHYFRLFKPFGISGIRKYFYLSNYKKISEPESINHYPNFDKDCIVLFKGIKNFFNDILGYNDLIIKILLINIHQKYLEKVNRFDFNKTIGVHIRLGDFSEYFRTPITWYKEMINSINEKLEYKFKILLFSDGKEDELSEITSIKNVERFYFGSSISDIIALSKCKLLIGSDSSFSGWGAYLGNVPSIFYKKHFGRIFNNGTCEEIIYRSSEIPLNLFEKI